MKSARAVLRAFFITRWNCVDMRPKVSWTAIALLVVWSILSDSGLAQNKRTTEYLTRPTNLWTSPNEPGHKAGKLLVATPVQLLSAEESWVEIAIEGWTQSGAERIIYAAPGMRVIRAALSPSTLDQLVFFQSVEDKDTGLTWTRTRLHGWLHNPELQPNLQELWNRAEALFAERCTVCHQRRIPHHYTANQWNSFLKIMGPRTGLPKEEQMLIRTYLQHHAMDKENLLENYR